MENQTIEQNECTQLEMLTEYKIFKTPIFAGIIHSREAIALKPIAENLGLNWSGVRQRIQRDPVSYQLSVSAKAKSADGKTRDMLCMRPMDFQKWLFTLPATENINVELWEIYKQELVITVLQMLKVSLDEVQRLRTIEQEYERLKLMTTNYINLSEEAEHHARIAKEKTKEIKLLQQNIIERMDKSNLQQLTIFN
jgi:hypothetical protein